MKVLGEKIERFLDIVGNVCESFVLYWLYLWYSS